MNLLGFMYEKGLSFAINYKTAFQYYNTAAANGSVLGMNNVGYLYDNGLGVEKI